MTSYKFIGQPIARIEDDALIKGAGSFVDDIRLPDTLEAAFVRSIIRPRQDQVNRSVGGACGARRARGSCLRGFATAADAGSAAVGIAPGSPAAERHAVPAGEGRSGLCRRSDRGGDRGIAAISRKTRRCWSRWSTSRLSRCPTAAEPSSRGRRARTRARHRISSRNFVRLTETWTPPSRTRRTGPN